MRIALIGQAAFGEKVLAALLEAGEQVVVVFCPPDSAEKPSSLRLLALLINRLVDPVLRLISGPAEWLNWLLVFLPMATGFVLARKLWLPYEVSFSIHMLLVDILLIWIPLSRISHFAFYFFSRAIHGVEFQTRRVVNP